MSLPVQQALNTIIPRRSGVLPPDLVELANSLLAQSRNKCSALKPEEEIARTYACANLACERLKTVLNLPLIEPTPPIPPRAYKKLYTYFDRTLTTTLARKKAKSAAASPSSAPNSSKKPETPIKPFPNRHTSSKETSFSIFRTNRTPKSGLKYGSTKEKDYLVPKWIQPVIRLLCKDLNTPRAAPHIIAGVESILTLPSPSSLLSFTSSSKSNSTPSQKKMLGKIPALIASVWFFVVVKMRGKQHQGKENMERKRLARESLARARSDEAVLKKVGEGDEIWVGWELVEERDVNAWRREIVEKGWKEMDWFENVVEGCGVNFDASEKSPNGAVENMNEDEDTNREIVVDKGKRKEDRAVRKLTTVQDKYDYLSEDKKREYQEWRAAMLAKVNELMEEAMMDEDSDMVIN